MAAFNPLEAMLIRAERWSDLLAVYREAVTQTLNDSRKKALLFKISHLEEERLYELPAAIRTYREISISTLTTKKRRSSWIGCTAICRAGRTCPSCSCAASTRPSAWGQRGLDGAQASVGRSVRNSSCRI